MDTEALNAFLTVAAEGSFSKAANTLDTSQSAISRAIAALEVELGVPLLVRFGARLTPIGERILSYTQQILYLQRQMMYEAGLEKSLKGGCVRIASFRSAATHLLPPQIAKFRQQFPSVDVTLQENEPNAVEKALLKGDADIGLLPLPRQTEGLETWEIAQDEFVLLLPPLAQLPQRELNWSDLSPYRFILYNYAECTSAVRNHWKACGQSLQVAFEIKEDSTIVSMVSQGLGAAILPRFAALPIPENVQVRSLPEPLFRQIGVAVSSKGLHLPAVFTFLDLLRGTGRFTRNEG
jgi:DNA-binding transcriptional LysR family regulator